MDLGKGEDLQTDEEGKDVDQDLLAMINHRKTNRCSEGNSFEVNHRGKEGKWIDSKINRQQLKNQKEIIDHESLNHHFQVNRTKI